MSPVIYCCTLCGVDLGNSPQTWRQEVRAVYINGHQWQEVSLSGLGRYIDPMTSGSLSVPRTAHERYDQPEFDTATAIKVSSLSPLYDQGFGPSPGSDLDEPKMETLPWGFYMHDACWKLLEISQGGRCIDLQLYSRVLRSFPNQPGRLDWGHDYSGLYARFDEHPLPYGIIEFRFGLSNDVTSDDSIFDELYGANPLEIPELQKFITHSSCSASKLGPSLLSGCTTSKDAFAVFPADICE